MSSEPAPSDPSTRDPSARDTAGGPQPQRCVPTELRRCSPSEIEIVWSDGATLRYRATLLRDRCPCATCRERRRGDEAKKTAAKDAPRPALPVLSAAEARPLTITHVRPVGHYAYNFALSDGHDSGLFPLALLREIGQP